MGRALKTSLGWLAIILVAFLLASIFSSEGSVKKANFTELEQYIKAGQVESAVIDGQQFRGKFRDPVEETNFNGQTRVYREFQTTLPYIDSDIVKQWQAHGLVFEFRDKNPGWFDYLWSAWPIVLIVFFWFFIMRRMQGGMGGQGNIFNFGKSKAKLISPEFSKVTFDDVAGADEAKAELQEIIEFLKNPDRFSRLGGKIPKGALLLGPPGTGKTLLARAVAGEAEVPFYSLSGADFVEMFVGVGASRVRDLFEQGKKSAPSIIFIDEIDAVGRTRGAGLGGGHDEREQTLNQLLVEMDGFDNDTGVILLASTNRPDVLDKALLRPGRFDRQIVVDIPGRRGREGILKVHTKNMPLDKDVDLNILARATPGLVGADLANLVNEAALLAARKDKDKVSMEDIEEAKDKVMMGVERKSVILSEEERRTTAFHESGHAVVAYHTEQADPLHKITIIPRGQSLGLTAQVPIDDKHSYSRTYIRGRLDVLMGGRAAEMIIFKDMTTGAANDLELATELARRMVVEWGMSDKIGSTTLGKTDQELFLGREIQQAKNVSEETARGIDNEIKAIIREAAERAHKLIIKHLDRLHLLGEALLKYETIHGEDLPRLFDGKPLLKVSSNGNQTTSKKNKTGGSRRRKKRSPSTKGSVTKKLDD
ncbi:MAG: ATP-dependent zinc metalloprotease FtsH [Candidatus Marinimicrobia bacterium]|nr:ATP-dependent zinc metalloprotease FtsH [Candidatus Neomarinimicrobiota bacterium]